MECPKYSGAVTWTQSNRAVALRTLGTWTPNLWKQPFGDLKPKEGEPTRSKGTITVSLTAAIRGRLDYSGLLCGLLAPIVVSKLLWVDSFGTLDLERLSTTSGTEGSFADKAVRICVLISTFGVDVREA